MSYAVAVELKNRNVSKCVVVTEHEIKWQGDVKSR